MKKPPPATRPPIPRAAVDHPPRCSPDEGFPWGIAVATVVTALSMIVAIAWIAAGLSSHRPF